MPFTRRTALKGMLATTVGAVTGATVYGIGYERHQLGVTEETIAVRGLPSSWDGRRIALLTDIHHSALVPADDVEQAVALANAQKPDLIVLGGDYVTNGDRDFAEPVAELLAPLQAPLGVFAILGNHDDDRDVPAALSRRGITVLRDQMKSVMLRGEGIELAGIRFWTREQPRIESIIKDARNPVILLAHDPRRLTEASALNVPAVLSGHTHGGQVVLPGLGAPAARKFPVVEGLASMGDTTLFVSRGVGTVYLPVRINCPPEIAVITLRSKRGSGVI
jgi:predicted MPP superfamily phosphohydrolase